MEANDSYRIIALDGVTNPQNLGMIIRSCAAGKIDAILLPTKRAAQISPLVIKASAGTLFKMPIIKTDNLLETLKLFQHSGASLYALAASAKESYKNEAYLYPYAKRGRISQCSSDSIAACFSVE
jgi:23S rRNA (guanosine2251-2'-O)-methyltransferase